MRIRSTTVDGHQFTRTRRGYDADEVDAVMARISATLREYEEQAEDLEARIAAAQTAAKVAKPRDERPVAAEIEAARAQAADIVRAANEEAERRRNEITALLDEARREAESLRFDAEQARAKLETAQLVEPEPDAADSESFDALRAEAMQDADAIRSQAREEAEALLSAALIEAGRLVSEAETELAAIVDDGHPADSESAGDADDESTTAGQLEGKAAAEAEAMLLVALDEAARVRHEAASEAAELRSVVAADVEEQRSALAEAARVHAEAEGLRRDLEQQIEAQRAALADAEHTRTAALAGAEELMAAALMEAGQIRAEAKADADEIRHRAAVEAGISSTTPSSLDEVRDVGDRHTAAALHAAEQERREMGRRLESLASTVLTIERRLAALSAAAAAPQGDATREQSAERAGRPAAGFDAPGTNAPIATAEPSAVHVIEPGGDVEEVDGVLDDTVTTSRAHGYAEPDGSGRPPIERATQIPEELIDPEAPDDDDEGPYRTFYQRAGRNLRERLRLEGQDPTQRGR